LKRILFITSIAFLLWTTAPVSHAQASPTATQGGSIQLGGGYSFGRTDIYRKKIQGFTVYGDFDFTRHWGIEGNIHRNSIITPNDVGLDSYLLGPRYSFHYRRFQPYVKGELGIGRYKTDYDPAEQKVNFSNTFKIFAVGGGLDYHLNRHLNIRAVDYEYQGWPGFGANGLNPYVFTFGAAYTFH